MPDTAATDRLERGLEKLTDAVGKISDTTHAIQLEQALQKAGIDAIKKSSEDTRGLLSNLRSEFDIVKDQNSQLYSKVLGEGGIEDVTKKLSARDTAWRTIWRTGGWIVGAIITLALLVTAIVYLVQAFVPSAPSRLGLETNAIVRAMKERQDEPAMSMPR